MDWFAHACSLAAVIENGDTTAAIESISDVLRSIPESPFHRVLDLDFTNSPEALARHFDSFIEKQTSLFEVKAIYTENNGFSINPGRWHFHVFAYRTCGDLKDHDWLASWDSAEFPDLTLTGMEELQSTYACDENWQDANDIAEDFCGLLVVAKFQDLIRRSVPHMNFLRVPLIATAHEYDWFAKFVPTERPPRIRRG